MTTTHKKRPVTEEDFKQAVRTMLEFLGEDITREGLEETPERVLRFYQDFFSGYKEDVAEPLARVFSQVDNYNEIVVVKDIDFVSFCEHHMLPIVGVAHVAYLPRDKVVGLSKIARVVDICTRKLQIQERFTDQIATAIQEHLNPQGVAVIIEASHQCMTIRGVNKTGARMKTLKFTGVFKDDVELQRSVLGMLAS